MNFDIFSMNGYGIYVWSSFLFTFLTCLFLFLKTKKTLRKLEKDFSKVQLENEKLGQDLNSMKVSLAERLSWTAGGGAAAGLLIKFIESAMK